MEDEYYFYDKDLVPGSFGLRNNGVICWCNSLLQGLISCPSFNRVLMESKAKANPLASELIKMIETSIFDNEDVALEEASSKIHQAFMRQLKSNGVFTNFGNSQECVDEALNLLVESIGLSELERKFTVIYECVTYCKECKNKKINTRDMNIKVELFTEAKLENSEDFCKWITAHPSKLSYHMCEKCENVNQQYRIEYLKRVSEIIVIIFNKFQQKDKRWFPETLTFPTEGGKLNYKVVASIDHFGNMHGGHYVCNVLRADGYKYINDSSVCAGSIQPGENTFMLFYHLDNKSN